MKKKIAALLLIALLLAGCAAKGPAPEPAAAPAEIVVLEPAEAAAPDEAAAPEEAAGDAAAPEAAEPGAYESLVFSTERLPSHEPIDESYIRGNRLTMINFWATWCGPCVGEMPDLSQLQLDYADKGFGILGIAVWDEQPLVEKMAEEKNFSYPLIMEPEIFQPITANLQGIPTTIFLDSSGQLVGEVVLGSRSYDEWAAIVDKLLAGLA